MEQALLISNGLLWVAVIVLALVVLALLRQIGVLQQRVAPAGALSLARGVRVGEAAPQLALLDLEGRALALGGAAAEGHSTLLFFLAPGCPVCAALVPVLRAMRASEGRWLRIVLASDGDDPAAHRAYAREQHLEAFPYVLSTPLGLAFQVGKLPYAVLIDATGVVRAHGLVNSREHLESLFEAQERGVASIQEHVRREQARAPADLGQGVEEAAGR